MIKLIVSDVDGTLVEDGSGGVNPELFDVILKLREKAAGPGPALRERLSRSRRRYFISPTTGRIWAATAGACL